jgi:hypothetical protein
MEVDVAMMNRIFYPNTTCHHKSENTSMLMSIIREEMSISCSVNT